MIQSNILSQLNLQNAFELFNASTENFIVRRTGGDNTTGVAGYVFDIVGVEEAALQSEITDHYVENNIAVQDHIALRPVSFTLRGIVGELNNLIPRGLAQIFSQVRGIPIVEDYAPIFAQQAQESYSEIASQAAAAQNAVAQASSFFGVFNQGDTTASRQQKAYRYFENLWRTRQTVTVETPYGIFENMSIEDFRGKQNEDTLTMSEFTIRLKQLRIVETVVSTDLERALGRVANIISDMSSNGRAIGRPANVSQLSISFAEQPEGVA